MKILLIDDEANKGWKEVLERFINNGQLVEIATEYAAAKLILEKEQFDLIFLDIRFGEPDHDSIDIASYGGYKIINELIRKDFSNKNFITPVILFTATNKAWNISAMLEQGADDFYIKEHPDYAEDIFFSKNNYIRLKGNIIPELLSVGKKRKEIWDKIQEIIRLSSINITNTNIKHRIEEKLKISYGILFRNSKEYEKTTLLFNNETISFIVLWSILEEIVKDSFRDNWIKNGTAEGEMNQGNWILKNGTTFIEDLRITNLGQVQGCVRVNIKKNLNLNQYEVITNDIQHNDKEINYYTGKIGLGIQVYGVLLLEKNWTPNQAKNKFEDLNNYRNKIDFIHSSISSIFNEKLSAKQHNAFAYSKCIEMLDFILDFLK